MQITQWKLRRLAGRVLKVYKRRGGETPVFEAFRATLVPHAESFIAKYDRAAQHESTWKRETLEGKNANAALIKLVRSWIPITARDIPGFTGDTLLDQPSVPEDVISDSTQFFNMVNDFRDAGGNPLPYLAVFAAQVDPAIATAHKEVEEALAADVHQQKLLLEMREAATVFNDDLKAFRRTLGNVVGRQDKDYQKLRAEKAHASDEEDDPTGPPAPQPMQPAAPGAPTPGPTPVA